MAQLVLAVGRRHGIRPQDVVGAIANEAGVPGRAIGHIDIGDSSCTVEIPANLSVRVLTAMRRATLRGQLARPRLLGEHGPGPAAPPPAFERAPREPVDEPRGFRPPRRAQARPARPHGAPYPKAPRGAGESYRRR